MIDTRKFFDQEASDYYRANYEQPRNRHEYTLWLRREACLSLMPTTLGRVLDLGCGPGAMTVPLVHGGREVVACDLSKEMVVTAARHMTALGAAARVAVADAAALPFADNSFAVVVTTGVLEYVPKLDAALAEIQRVLKPEGVLIGTMSLPRRLERYAVRRYGELRGRPSGAQQYVMDRREFDRAIEGAGFRIDARRCCSFVPFPLDAIWPRSVLLVDSLWGDALNRVAAACDQAKTYIVRAITHDHGALLHG